MPPMRMIGPGQFTIEFERFWNGSFLLRRRHTNRDGFGNDDIDNILWVSGLCRCFEALGSGSEICGSHFLFGGGDLNGCRGLSFFFRGRRLDLRQSGS